MPTRNLALLWTHAVACIVGLAPLERAEAAVSFADVTSSVGLVEPLEGFIGHAAAWGDVNGDGFPDLYVGTFANHPGGDYAYRGHGAYAEPNKLFINKGGRSFEEVIDSPTRVKGRASGAAFADFDNDGDLDLVLSNISFSPTGSPANAINEKLFRNDGGSNFVDVTQGSGLSQSLPFTGRNTFVLDYDGDGLLDIFLQDDDTWGQWSVGHSHLMRNVGGMRFVDVTAEAGLPIYTHGLGGFAVDINFDGWTDIYLAHSDRLYINRGNGKFAERRNVLFPSRFSGAPEDGNQDWPCGADAGDLDGDGDLDVVVGDHYKGTEPHTIRVFLNDGIAPDGFPSFRDVTSLVGVKTASTREPVVVIEDLDNDGKLDIVVSNVGLFAYHNAGTSGGLPHFDPPIASAAPRGGLGYWAAATMADYDRDGLMDFFAAEWNAAAASPLLRNTSTGVGNYIDVRVQSPAGSGNPNGIGATVRIYAEGHMGEPAQLLGVRPIAIANGYSSGSLAWAHFGVVGRQKVDVEVTLPAGGAIISVPSAAVGQLLTVSDSNAALPGDQHDGNQDPPPGSDPSISLTGCSASGVGAPGLAAFALVGIRRLASRRKPRAT